jgi:hypothetical protein
MSVPNRSHSRHVILLADPQPLPAEMGTGRFSFSSAGRRPMGGRGMPYSRRCVVNSSRNRSGTDRRIPPGSLRRQPQRGQPETVFAVWQHG